MNIGVFSKPPLVNPCDLTNKESCKQGAATIAFHLIAEAMNLSHKIIPYSAKDLNFLRTDLTDDNRNILVLNKTVDFFSVFGSATIERLQKLTVSTPVFYYKFIYVMKHTDSSSLLQPTNVLSVFSRTVWISLTLVILFLITTYLLVGNQHGWAATNWNIFSDTVGAGFANVGRYEPTASLIVRLTTLVLMGIVVKCLYQSGITRLSISNIQRVIPFTNLAELAILIERGSRKLIEPTLTGSFFTNLKRLESNCSMCADFNRALKINKPIIERNVSRIFERLLEDESLVFLSISTEISLFMKNPAAYTQISETHFSRLFGDHYIVRKGWKHLELLNRAIDRMRMIYNYKIHQKYFTSSLQQCKHLESSDKIRLKYLYWLLFSYAFVIIICVLYFCCREL